MEFIVWWIWGQYITKGALVIFDGLKIICCDKDFMLSGWFVSELFGKTQ